MAPPVPRIILVLAVLVWILDAAWSWIRGEPVMREDFTKPPKHDPEVDTILTVLLILFVVLGLWGVFAYDAAERMA